jgi:hypothetical protein
VTLPRTTRVSVPSQRSETTQRVPRTVAELKRPEVRKRPLPSPHRWRDLRLAAARAADALGQLGSAPARARVVIGCDPVVWPMVKVPS